MVRSCHLQDVHGIAAHHSQLAYSDHLVFCRGEGISQLLWYIIKQSLTEWTAALRANSLKLIHETERNSESMAHHKQQATTDWHVTGEILMPKKPHHDNRVQVGSSVLNHNHRFCLSLSLPGFKSYSPFSSTFSSSLKPHSARGSGWDEGETWGCGN